MYKYTLNRDAFGKALLKKKWSPLQLALESGIADNTVYRAIRSGEVTAKTLCKIADALDVLPTDLIFENFYYKAKPN